MSHCNDRQSTQAKLANQLGFWPTTAKGGTWTRQRCGRNENTESA